ncbi:MAG TPA: hypothetical protein VJ867_08300 [Gemmatimonadaceae bacterium]|nr:hypothetical protein [Gemmatimonadaceae bacterium]
MAVRAHRGFALIFVVVTLGVMAILATVMLFNTDTSLHQRNIRNAVTALRRFKGELGAAGVTPTYRGDVLKYPGRLSYLYAKIATTDNDACGTFYVATDVSRWAGPYHLIPMLRTQNYQLAPGIVAQDQLLRVPPSGTAVQPAVLQIQLTGVAAKDAQDLGMALDGVPNGSGAQITFTPNGNNPVDVLFNINIVGC